MPDIFDSIAEDKPKGDIFDQIGGSDEQYLSTDIPPRPVVVPEQPTFIGEQADSSLENPAWLHNPNRKAALDQEIQRAKERVSQLTGLAAGFATPQLSIPATAGRLVQLGGAALNVGASGAVQATAEEASKQILGAAEPSATKLGTEALKGFGTGAGFGAAGYVGGSLLGRGVAAVSEALNPAADKAKRVAATLFPSLRKPTTDAQQRALEARQTIQSITGEEVPIGVAEAIGKPGLARKFVEVGKEGSEFTADEQDSIKRIVAMAATELRGANPSANELGERAVNVLQDELGRVSAPTKAAVQAVADELHPALSKAMVQIQDDAQKLIPGTVASPTASGNAIRETVQKGLNDLTDEAQAAYSKAKLLADPNGVPVQIPSIKTQVAKIDFETPHTVPSGASSAGRPVPTLVPAESRKFVADIKDAGDEWTLQQALRVRSEIGRAIGDSELLPGIGRGDLKGLYKGLTEDIEHALSPSSGNFADDKALNAWRNAWKLTKETSEKYKYPLVENIVDEFGREGGTGPASIASKLTTPEAPSVLKALEVAAGPHAPQMHKAVGEYLFNQVGNAARDVRTGEISVGDLLSGINKLAPEVRARYFPNVDQVRKLANREAALVGLRTSVSKGGPDSLISNLQSTDSALLAEALGPTPSAEVTKKLQLALSEQAREQALYNGTILGRLKAGDADGLRESVLANPAKFARSIVSGAFSPSNARKAIEILKVHDTDAFRSLQFHYVDQLLNKNVSEAFGISTPKIAKDLSEGGIASARTQESEMAETVLGRPRYEALKKVMAAFSELDKQGNMLTPNSPVVDLAARTVGGAIGSTGAIPGLGAGSAGYQANFIARNAAATKHWLASYLLQTQELRKLALTPISQVSRTQMQNLMRGFSSFVLTQVPHGSNAEQEALELQKQAER